MNEELLKEIKSSAPWLIAAVIVAFGYFGFERYTESRRAAASEALANSYTLEEIEEAVAKFGGSKTGGAMKLKLAKKLYDDGRYEDALAKYDELVKEAPEGYADVPAVGRAYALEGLKRYGDAAQAYNDFVAANPKSFLALTAKIGAARVMALSGKKDEALKSLSALKEEVKGEQIAKVRVEAAEDLVKRL